jgi:hypothetical protein
VRNIAVTGKTGLEIKKLNTFFTDNNTKADLQDP